MSRRLLVALLTAVVAAAVAAAPASATAETYEASCVPWETAPICTFWEGTVTRIEDGDTLRVRVDGETSSQRVRITGIQAMELTVHGDLFRAGDCHAIDATNRLDQLVEAAEGRVRISAMDEGSFSRNRERRSVAVQIGSRWVDVGRRLLNEGLALWLPARDEWAWNARYSTYAERAAAAGIGMWQTSSCGEGPNEGQAIEVTVNGDADGLDNESITGQHGEWARVVNRDPVAPLDLTGWWLRDSDLREYAFPDGFTLPPGFSATVHVGRGVDTGYDLYWGLGSPVFDNVRRDRELGDGAYLFDPQGDLRAWMTYPCRLSCTDPNTGSLQLAVQPGQREQILVANVGGSAIDLAAYRVGVRWHGFAFAPGTVLQPGETLRIVARRDPARDEPLTKGWGKRAAVLPNRGGAVRLANFRGAVLACAAWGTGSC